LSEFLVVSVGVGLGLGLSENGVGSDGGVDLGEELFEGGHFGFGQAFRYLGELQFESVRIVGLQLLHVVIDMDSENSVPVDLGIIRSVISIHSVPGESLGAVGHVEASVAGSLEGSEDSVSHGGVGESHVQHRLEGSSFRLVFVHVVVFSVHRVSSRVKSLQ